VGSWVAAKRVGRPLEHVADKVEEARLRASCWRAADRRRAGVSVVLRVQRIDRRQPGPLAPLDALLAAAVEVARARRVVAPREHAAVRAARRELELELAR